MGVHRLNQFLRDNAGPHIQEIALADLRGKRIAVDASIYMYRFLGERGLLAGMYQMCKLFQAWGIDAVFVFDGRPPPAKNDSQQERQKRKEEAYIAHQRLEEEVRSGSREPDAETNAELEQLRRKSLRLGRRRISEVRELLRLQGVAQMDASEEADSLCAGLVASGDCWACLTDDTDLFACGCPRVLRYMDLHAGSCVLYDWEGQRREMGISQDEFRCVCAAAGCDYGPGVPGVTVEEAWRLWRCWKTAPAGLELIEYLMGYGATWRGGNERALRQAVELFRKMGSERHIGPRPGEPDAAAARTFLEERGFVFPE